MYTYCFPFFSVPFVAVNLRIKVFFNMFSFQKSCALIQLVVKMVSCVLSDRRDSYKKHEHTHTRTHLRADKHN